jgi:F-type H+-transporting ATPase subunit epsilon
MAEPLQVRVVTPDKPIFEGAADFVVVPAHDGELGILPRHARLLASLGVGELRITQGGTLQRFFLEAGFVQVAAGNVTILCERATPLSQLDPAVLEAAAQQAKAAGAPNASELQQRALVMRRVAARAGK